MPAYRYGLLIKHILEHVLVRAPDKEIVYRDKVRYTYKGFYERVCKLASVLEEIGVKKGSKIGILDWDTHNYLEAYYAIPMMGAIMHTINLRLPPELILYTIRHAGDDFLMVRDEFLPLIERVKDKLVGVKGFIVASESKQVPETPLEPVYNLEEMMDKASPSYEFPDLPEDTDATIFYTTGTTGMPKGVIFTHRQIVLHTFAIALSLSGFYPSPVTITSRDVLMPLVPFFHVHSWGLPYAATLGGCKMVLLGRYDPGLALEMIAKEGVTFSHMVPSILHMIVNHPRVHEYRDALSRWKVVIGGAALPRGLAEQAMRLGIKVMAGYGLSETCPVLTLSVLKDYMAEWPDEKKLDVLIKTGIPAPLVKLRVVDNQMRDVPRDGKHMGEIVVRAPWCTREYYNDPERTEELWAGGWMHTGDVAVWDEEGYIQITGRAKFVIKSGGEWIPPLILENLLSLHPAVSEVAVVGVPSDKWGERPIAIVATKPEYRGKVTEEELRKHLEKAVEEGKILKWWIPEKFIFVEQIPKTTVGKIDRLKLMEEYKKIKLP
ncbi:MAG: fatty acid--CoA ligase [Thermoproteota archaeon]|nr:MAG: fatty acid--CoA ligase [Candidatus Korarchaeota archaeon]RLG55107.1 MAG: fatty acid--CoA ligase [Candidatus Korarchaeota archaeon]